MRHNHLVVVRFLLIFFVISFSACSGESGFYATDGDVPDDQGTDVPDVPCPQDQVCGETCCNAGDECVFNQCLPPCEFERCRMTCCGQGEECVNEMQCLPVCENERCGDNLTVCCDEGQRCLDGVICVTECNLGETVCGGNLDTCCPIGDLCLNNACVTPSNMCSDNYDCPDDSYYCDTSVWRCLPVGTGEICSGEPTFWPIEPVMEWYWPGITYNAVFYGNVIASPAVGDVDGDGVPDVVFPVYAGADMNNTLLVALSGNGDGAGNPRVLFTIPSAADPVGPKPYRSASVALANFDDDPALEIVYNIHGGGIRIVKGDGLTEVCDHNLYPACTGRRTTGVAVNITGGPHVSDLDHDGMPDILVYCTALNGHDISNAALDFAAVAGCAFNTTVADLNEDGFPEIVDVKKAITIDPATPGGVPLWSNALTQTAGFIAVADIFPDIPGPEVIFVRTSLFILNGRTGAILVGAGGSIISTAVAIPGGGSGGAPTVADFDGDGLPEISTAGQAFYVVYDPDCWDPPLRTGGLCASGATNFMLWQTPTQDLSSSQTGSSVFDFQGDGIAEVLYNDECFFHIYDGQTGTELVDPKIPSSSRTDAEYSLVSDVDGDGNAEMLVISNADQAINRDNCHVSWKTAGVSIDWLCQYTTCTAGPACTGGIGGTCAGTGYQCDAAGICRQPAGTHGVRVYGDAYDRWVRTRPVWGQFNYHVTDIESANGEWNVPLYEPHNWLSYNNYRQNVQGGALFPVPDLALSVSATVVCPREVRLLVVVRNLGSMGVPAGVGVRLVREDTGTELATLTTATTILPGGLERLLHVYEDLELNVDMTFSASLDDGNVIEECEETNNTALSEPVRCEPLGK
ncbi:hypothetical protein KJ612_13805 [Myxococcota bacterium]|nr:hypothetical protein [Myxococcota bacterium]